MGFFNHLFSLDKFNAVSSQPPAPINSTSEMGLPAEIVALVLAEIDVDIAISAHENWKERLQSVLDGQPSYFLPIDVACHDNYCDLGKWLHGAGGLRFARYPAFIVLLAQHRDFHIEAARVLAHAQAGDMKKAHAILHGSYHQASSQVVLLLKELKRSLRH
jgi:Chemoreceptor zinc-binding domain